LIHESSAENTNNYKKFMFTGKSNRPEDSQRTSAYTPGKLGLAHPIPKEVAPTSSQFPFTWDTKGPPESPLNTEKESTNKKSLSKVTL
jgi:hypothetical protein